MSTPALSALLLHVHRHAAVDGDARDRRVIREALDLIFDLHGQLARRRQDQRARAPAARGRVASLRNRCRIGTRNAAVLPVPVSAQAMTSRPASASGMTPLCTGRVSAQPRSRMPLSSRASSCRAVERDRRRVERRRLVGQRGRLGRGADAAVTAAAAA